MKICIPARWKILFFIMLISIFKPAYLPSTALTMIYRVAQAASLAFLLLSTFRKRIRNYKLIGLFALYYSILLASTLVNGGNLIEVIQEILTTLLVVLWVHQCVERDSRTCVSLLMLVFEFLIYINLITVIVFPGGLYKSIDAVVSARHGWFLGHQSLFAMYAGPAICVGTIYMYNAKNFWSMLRWLFLVVACFVTVAKLGSANNIVCLGVISLGTLLLWLFRFKDFNFKIVYITILVLVLVIVVFQTTDFLEPIVVNYLHRSMTFTDRVFIWSRAVELIKCNLLFGCGLQTDVILLSQLNAAHAHNQYLQCLYLGGIFELITFCCICFISFGNLKKYTATLPGRVFISTVVALMIQMIFEVYFHHTMGKVLIVLSFYFGSICNVYEKDEIVIHKRRKFKCGGLGL